MSDFERYVSSPRKAPSGAYILHHRDDAFEGRRVYFTTSDPLLLALRLPGSRAEALLLPPDVCPPHG